MTNEKYLPIIMCTWGRIKLLPETLEMLEAQTRKDFFLCIWNNNIKVKEEIDRIAGDNKFSYEINVYHSEKNIKGWGRFELARQLLLKTKYPFIAFIDDDVTFGEKMVAKFLGQKEQKTIKSFWAFRFLSPVDRYWRREYVMTNKGIAHYCGTGGMIFDSDILFDEKFFDDIPEEYKDVEDLWISFFAAHILKWKLLKGNFPIYIRSDDGKNQYTQIRNKKDVFLQSLHRKYGWPADSRRYSLFRMLQVKFYNFFYRIANLS